MTKFTETQAFPAAAYGVLSITTAAVIYTILTTFSRAGGGSFWPILPLGLAGNLLCQKTIVTDTDLIVTFGALFPLYRRRIARRQIVAAENVIYSPLADYGGWGIRGWGKDVAFNACGNRGVRLTLIDGRRVLVGSQRSEELAEALTALH